MAGIRLVDGELPHRLGGFIGKIAVSLPSAAKIGVIRTGRDHVVYRHVHQLPHIPARPGIRMNRHIADAMDGQRFAAHGLFPDKHADCRLELAVLGHDIAVFARLIFRLVELGQELQKIRIVAVETEYVVDEIEIILPVDPVSSALIDFRFHIA